MQYSGKGSPSSGFVGTWLLLQLCGRVDVYGVGLGGPAQGTVNDQDTFVPPAWRRQRRRRSSRLRRSLLMTETTPATTRARRSSTSGGGTPSASSSGSAGGGSLADSANSKGSATSFHYFERRNYRDSREFGDQPHHSWDLEHDALQVRLASLSLSP